MTVLRDGYRVPFLDSPPLLSRTPVSFPTYQAGSPRAQALQQEIEGMLAKGALEIARDPRPGFYSRLFLVEKASGGWRPVIDLSHLNEFVQLTPFKMETVASVLLSVREGDFLASLDLKGAYFQIPILRSSRKLLRFTLEGTVYQFQALCFGLSTAPQVFTRVFAVVSAWVHSPDQTSPLSGRLVGSLLLGVGSQAGRPVAPLALSHPQDCDKREEVGSRALAEVSRHDHRYRGRQGFSVSGASREIPDGCGELMYHGHTPSAALAGDPRSPGFARAAGSSPSPSEAHFTVASEAHWSPESDPPSLPVPLPREVRRDLSWWMVRDHLLTGVRFGTPAPDLHLYSDASCSGWGAYLLDQYMSGVWSDQEQLLHINLLEMKALFLGLQAFREDVIGHHVTAMCDNSTVVAYINKQGGTVSQALCLLGSRLLRWTESFDIHLGARYLPGHANVLADVLSCRGQVVGTEWSLHPQVVTSLRRALTRNCHCIAR